MRTLILWLGLAGLFWPGAEALAYLELRGISPEQPVAGEMVSVLIYEDGCDGIVWLEGYPQVDVRDGVITAVFFSVHNTDPMWCSPEGEGVSTLEIGVFPAGSYTLHVERDYLDFGGMRREVIGSLEFSVLPAAAGPVHPVPAAGSVGLLILLLGLATLALRHRRTGLLALAAFLLPCVPQPAAAQGAEEAPDARVIELLLSDAPGVPTARALVDWYAGISRSDPWPALSATGPETVEFLLPIRARGDFLARLEASPESARAKLERYVLVVYPATTDLAPILTMLRANPWVAAAGEAPAMQFSRAQATVPRARPQRARQPGLQRPPERPETAPVRDPGNGCFRWLDYADHRWLHWGGP